MLPIHSLGHSFGSAKSQLFFGTRKPKRAALVTMARPTRPPSSEGNSGPRKTPVKAYGTVKATPAKSAKGSTSRPAFQLFSRPKKRVSIITMISGITVPTMAWMIATLPVITCRKTSQLEPLAASCAPIVALSRPLLTPMMIGVPTAPKDTGVLCTSMPSSTAASAGKPIATSSGAAIAAGVPKPDAPSMKQPNSHAMMIAWMRRSGLIVAKPARIAVMPPEYFSVLSSRMAPKMIHSTPTVITSPCRVEASTRLRLISHTYRPMPAVRK